MVLLSKSESSWFCFSKSSVFFFCLRRASKKKKMADIEKAAKVKKKELESIKQTVYIFPTNRFSIDDHHNKTYNASEQEDESEDGQYGWYFRF